VATTPLHPPALVLGTGLTALGVMRSLGRAGIPSLALSGDPDFEAKSRWYRGHGERLGAWAGADELAALLSRSGLEGGVPIPCSDHWAMEITRLPADLATRFPVCAPDGAVLEALIDKSQFRDALVRTGVAHPHTAPVESAGDIDALLEAAPAGAFLKPTDSQRFVSVFGTKAFRVSGADEARACYQRAREQGIELVLQEYIPGPADRHYFVDGFVGRDHTITACFARRRLRMHPPDFGNSSAMVSIDPGEVGPAVDALRALFAATRYRGIFSAEFKRDDRDDLFKLLEVNCRPWWYVEFCARCGVNVPAMAYRDALGQDPGSAWGGTAGVELVYGYYDLQACRRMTREGRTGPGTCLRSWVTSDKPIFCWDDPTPALSNLSRRVRSWIRRRISGR
jgi:predicted ATP-grasp superfamily ATP-dependent carboligase